jgi:hypothetical protein
MIIHVFVFQFYIAVWCTFEGPQELTDSAVNSIKAVSLVAVSRVHVTRVQHELQAACPHIPVDQ